MHFASGLEAICQADASLAAWTWYKLGGPARWLVTPRDEDELIAVLERCRVTGTPWRVLGRGANVLVSDAGFAGAVIRLGAPGFTQVAWDDAAGRVQAGAGCDFPKLVKAACGRGLVGLEVLAGIPGQLGGIIRMNAGGKYGEVASFVREVRVVTPEGRLANRDPDRVGFGYRRTELADAVVVGATLQLQRGDGAAALDRYKEIWREKYATQPPVAQRSAGCIFKNPGGGSAGRLIDECGLKGLQVGGARVSERHANFIVAEEGARADDVLRLIAQVRERVAVQAGVELQLEIDVW